jgi:vesicle-associated membrane protein 7
MPIFYALVARGKTVLAEFTARSGNFPTITRVLLDRISSDNQKMSYVYDKHVFHYMVEAGITYLCLAADASRRRVPFAFLDDIKERFSGMYGQRAQTAIAFAMNAEFARVLQDRMDYYNTNPDADKFGAIHNKIGEVKDIMMENIDKVLARGEKIELLVDKTNQLSVSAQRFQKQSRNLKNQMWWKNVKMWAMIIFVCLVVLYIILGLICGFTFKKC